MKRIVIDARFWSQSGIGRYIRNLITNLQNLDSENEYFILLNDKDFLKVNFEKNFHKIHADISWYGLKEQYEIPRIIRKLDPDLVHFPHFNIPLLYTGNFIVTIHDLIHQHFQMQRATTHSPFIYKIKKIAYDKVFQNAVKRSLKVITVSNFVRNQLVNDWDVDNKKIVITLEAPEDKFIQLANHMKNSMVSKELQSLKISKKDKYLFYVGNAHPHKNIERLIKAYLSLKKEYPSLKLVLSGDDHYFWSRIKQTFREEGIIYTGYITDRQLVALYKQALIYVLPSLEEGFGIPLLEAFACGCPVASSDKASLPEVGGSACLYFNPLNLSDMERTIKRLINNEKLRKEMIKKGLVRYKEFSWEKLAQETLMVYKQFLD